MRFIASAAVLALVGTSGVAEPITGKEARAALFRPGPVEIEVLELPFLTDQDRVILGQIALEQRYYGAVAFGPDDGLLSDSLMGAFNYHDVATARTAALAGCEAQRTGATPCTVVAEVRPRGWEAGRAVSLSGDATDAFRSGYRRAGSPKAMAISPSTGQFAVSLEPGAAEAARAACDLAAQANDCRVVLAD